MNNRFVVLIICTTIIVLSLILKFGTISIKPDVYKEVPSIISFLFFLALFMERAMEVFLSTLRGGEADLKDKKINDVKEDLNELINPKNTGQINTQAIKDKKEELTKLIEERTKFRIRSREIALRSTFIFGILVSALGIRLFEALIDLSTINNSYQESIFIVFDIFLTGSVLAGGSTGINQLTKAISSFLQTTPATHKK